MSRKLKDGILKNIQKYTENTEVPSIFSLWVGISTISATLGRDCFIDLGHFTVYPNTYIVLIAGSARCRKSTSIGVGVNFMKHVEPQIKTLSQKMTPEALISSLSGYNEGEGETSLVQTAEGIFVVDELATLLDRNAFNSGMVPLLTKLYDSEDFTYETKSRGTEEINNPCLSLLGGSTLHWIKEAIPLAAIGGGFTSRIVFVYKDTFENLVPFPSLSKENKKLADDIINDLNEARTMRGEFKLSDKAVKLFEEEYKEFMTNSSLFEDENLAGYAGRRHVTLLKVAMCISASMSNKLLIEYDDVRIARDALRMVEEEMPRVLKSIQSEFVGDASEEVLALIVRRGWIYRSQLVKKMAYKLTAQQLNVILDTLLEYRDRNGNNVIEIEKEGKRTKYVYVGKE